MKKMKMVNLFSLPRERVEQRISLYVVGARDQDSLTRFTFFTTEGQGVMSRRALRAGPGSADAAVGLTLDPEARARLAEVGGHRFGGHGGFKASVELSDAIAEAEANRRRRWEVDDGCRDRAVRPGSEDNHHRQGSARRATAIEAAAHRIEARGIARAPRANSHRSFCHQPDFAHLDVRSERHADERALEDRS